MLACRPQVFMDDKFSTVSAKPTWEWLCCWVESSMAVVKSNALCRSLQAVWKVSTKTVYIAAFVIQCATHPDVRQAS